MSHIRDLRQARGLSQADLAMLLGVQTGTVGQWERGYATPHPRTAAKLARKLGVTVEELGLGDRP